MTDTTTLDTTPDSEELPELVESETPRERRHRGGHSAQDPRAAPVARAGALDRDRRGAGAQHLPRLPRRRAKTPRSVWGIVITLAILVGASLIAAAPRLRTSSLAMILGGVFLVVSLSGLRLARAEPRRRRARGRRVRRAHGRGGGHRPRRGAGVGQVRLHRVHRAGGHRRVRLHRRHRPHARSSRTRSSTASSSPPTPADPGRGKVDLAAGEYTIYCNVTGHEAQGMVANLTVAE